jgi:hypothetical protein
MERHDTYGVKRRLANVQTAFSSRRITVEMDPTAIQKNVWTSLFAQQ